MSGKIQISIIASFLIVAFYQVWFLKNRRHSSTSTNLLDIADHIKKIQINIGPNYTPLLPSKDEETAVIAVEANLGVSNILREKYQKGIHAKRFFVINSAVSSYPLAGSLKSFHYYNKGGRSSSLSQVVRDGNKVPRFALEELHNYSDPSSPGIVGQDFVTGHDLNVVKSASHFSLRRIETIISETFIGKTYNRRYQSVNNDIEEWIPFMKRAGFELKSPPPTRPGEWDAIWIRK